MGMLQQLQRLQQQIAEAQERLAQETVTASAGGGAVKVTMSGDLRCQAVEIDPALLNGAEVEMMQDLVLTAVNLALEKARLLQQQQLGPLVGGLPV
jgi:DNA-binding YbaB/EbfC family protein